MEKIIMYLQYPFVQYALIAGTLIALCSALMGTILVLRHFSFIGDSLSHVAFGAMSVASVLKLTNEMFLVLPVTIVTAIFLLCKGKKRGDAVLAVASTAALAFGYLVMNLAPKSNNVSGDVCSTLFGSTSILTLSVIDVWICVILSMVVLVLFIVFYNKIFRNTFDEEFALATGEKTRVYNVIMATVIATVIVLAMNLVGSLLITALIIFPVLSAIRLFNSFKGVCIASSTISVLCAVIGMLISILAGTPVGSTVVAVDAIAFAVITLVTKKFA